MKCPMSDEIDKLKYELKQAQEKAETFVRLVELERECDRKTKEWMDEHSILFRKTLGDAPFNECQCYADEVHVLLKLAKASYKPTEGNKK